MKHIAFIAHLSEVSGSGVALVSTAAAMQKHFRVSLILPGKGPLADRAREVGIDTVIIANPQVDIAGAGLGGKISLLRQRARYVSNLKAYLKRESVDLAYINSSASVFAALAARGAHVPIAWHIHETLNQRDIRTRVKSAVIRRWADGLIYASQSSMNSLSHPAGKPDMIARNAVAFRELDEIRTKRLAQPHRDQNDPPIIAMNGTVPLKGTDVLLRAITSIIQSNRLPAAPRLIIAGPPVADAQFNELVDGLSSSPELKGQVEFCGMQKNLFSIYAAVNLFVSASHTEAMPIALVEAMAAGVPVVATAVGDCAELLNGGQNGWLVEPADPEALAEAIIEALCNPDLARQKAQLAYNFIKELYGAEDFWLPLTQFVTNILNRSDTHLLDSIAGK